MNLKLCNTKREIVRLPAMKNNVRKVAFLGSKAIGAYCLNTLLTNREELEIDVVLVLTNNRSISSDEETVSEVANRYAIPTATRLNALFNLNELDFIISVQYHEILKQEHISKARLLAMNLHMAPLPEYRGCNQFSFAILDQAKEFGTTLHKMEPGIDDGAILAEKRFPIPDNCRVNELYELTLAASKNLFDENIKAVLNGRFTPVEQKHLIEERGTSLHFRKEMESIKEIDLSWPEEKIDRHIRATFFPPFPPPYALINGKKIELTPNWRNEIP